MKLFEYDLAIVEAMENAVDEETGEINEGAMIWLDRLSVARDEKIESLFMWLKEIKAEADAIRNEEKALEKRRLVVERKADGLKQFLQKYLRGEKFKTPKVSVSYRKTSSVSVAVDPHELPAQFQRVSVDADKTAIKEALQKGEEVAGCSIVEKQSMIVK